MAAPEQPAAAPPSDLSGVNVVETPTSPSSAFTLSRFEFETGTKGNEGTKILMVEWDAAAAAEAAGRGRGAAAGTADDWDVRWEGKEALPVLPIRDGDAPAGSLRVYFLVPPGAPIPTLVTIARRRPGGPSSAAAGEEGQGGEELRARPLPAIFPEGLAGAAGGGDKGSRGVLHTVWARKRLGELGAEIAAEMRSNGEGVGLEMALQERQWIVDHFGLEVDTSSAGAIPLAPGGAAGAAAAAARPASPRSPVGGRLGERLRGLKLATSPAELLAAKEAVNTKKQAERKITVFTPESGGAGLGLATSGGLASLGAVMEGGAAAAAPARGGDTEEDLFALPMSPRSPEEAKSPFSMLKC